MLIAQAVPGTIKLSANGCKVLDGAWVDPYTGVTYRGPKAVQIDHVVALREAHDSGGWAWPIERKRAYAQGLTPGALLVVGNGANEGKGNRDPAEWLPRVQFRCAYVRDWIDVKRRWHLTMDRAEVDAITTVLRGCPEATAGP